MGELQLLFDILALELQELIISFSSVEWRAVSKYHKSIADRYLLQDYRFKIVKSNVRVIVWTFDVLENFKYDCLRQSWK